MIDMNDLKEGEKYVAYTSTWSSTSRPLNDYFNPNYMQYLIELLKGKKTYLVAFVTLLYALVLVGWQQGDWNQASELILAALGLGALRNGLK